jgi:hypothetical protein
VKTTVGLLAAVLLSAVPAHAQAPSFGVKAGFNLADLSFKDAPNTLDSKNRTGLVAGVFVIVPCGNLFAFQPEALISQQGSTFTEGSESFKIKIDYFQVPLLARIKPSKSPVGLVVGPTLGFRIRAKTSGSGQSEEDFKDEVKQADLGLVAGVSVDVAHIVLDGRYTWGLTNIATDSSDGKVKNRVASLTLGFRF